MKTNLPTETERQQRENQRHERKGKPKSVRNLHERETWKNRL